MLINSPTYPQFMNLCCRFFFFFLSKRKIKVKKLSKFRKILFFSLFLIYILKVYRLQDGQRGYWEIYDFFFCGKWRNILVVG